MCSCNDQRYDFLPFPPSFYRTLSRHREWLLAGAAGALAIAAVIGVLAYLLIPGDIQQAESDIQKAKDIVLALDEEAAARHTAAWSHRSKSAEFQRCVDAESVTGAEWGERNRAMLDGHSQLSRANIDRRDNLIHLTAVYVRLVTEAETELLRAKDARDRGTPYKVASRVREILTPILNTR